VSEKATVHVPWWQRLTGSWPGVLLVFLGAALLAYLPALNGPLMWDDYYLVGTNPFFRSPVFIGEVFKHWLYLDSTSQYYRPVQNLSYLLDYWLWSGVAYGYHLTNILLHGLCGASLFTLLRRRLAELDPTNLRVPAVALGVALLWTVHPAHNAAVAYIAGRADSLAMLGAIVAWLLADASGPGRRLLFVLPAMLCALLALCAKELAIFWFVLFALHRLVIARKPLALIPALLVVGVYFVLRSLPEARAAVANAGLPAGERALVMLRALGDYAGMLVWPARLMMDRSISSPVMYQSYALWLDNIEFEYLSVVGLAALLFIGWKCRSHAPGRRWRLAGVVWFALGFLPISNLFPLNAQVAEHWIYHASIGAFIFAAGCLEPQSIRWPRAVAAVVSLLAVAFAVRTAVRAGDWADPERFYVKNVRSGGGTPRIHTQLAQIYAERHDYAKQEAVLRDLLVRFPEHSVARINLAGCLSAQGRTAEAEELLKRETANTHSRFPRSWIAALQLVNVRASQGDTAGALQASTEALRRFPDTWEVIAADARIRAASGDLPAARTNVEAFAAAHWWHLESWLVLADLCVRTNDMRGASQALSHASQLDLYDTRAMQRALELRLGLPRSQ
jgi:cytochrome c-type biogenesis protein CcmH/NrfG